VKKSTKAKNAPKRKNGILLLCIIIILIGIAVTAALLILRRNDREPQPDPITLTYANWNMTGGNELEVQMIRSFMDEYPHITVHVDHSITLPWMVGIATAAGENRLPDVFAIDDLATNVTNGWLLDLTSLAWADLDFFDLPRAIQEAVLLDGYVYALPAAQDIHGYFINRDLFRALGLDVPTFGISAEDFIDSARRATDLSHPSMGLNHSLSFVDWYPGAVNPALSFFGFDGRGFALNSSEMLEAVHEASALHRDGYTFASIPPDRVRDYFPIGYDLGAFRIGQVAMFYGGAWLMDIMLNEVAFDWDFIGVPGGRSVVTLDIHGVSVNTEHPEEAYLLARWMGHGQEGNLRRLQYAREMGITLDNFPITQNQEVLDSLWETIPAPGFRYVYDAMERALVDGARVLPGYMQARLSAPTGVDIPGTLQSNTVVGTLLNYSILGYVDFADYAAIAEEVARQQLDAARR